jgi:hypothetical protein
VSASNTFTVTPAPLASAYTAPAVAYNPGGGSATSFSIAAKASGSPTGFAVGSAATAQGGAVSITNAGLVSYTAPVGFRGNDSFTYTASNAGGTSAPAVVTVPVSNPALSATLSGSGTRGVALGGVAIAGAGGLAPYSCATTLVSGALPAGTTLASDCTIIGTPTASGSFSFTVGLTDSSQPAFTQTSGTLTLVIAAPTLTLTPSTLPGATAGVAYSQALSAGGGVAPYSYAVTTGGRDLVGYADAGGHIQCHDHRHRQRDRGQRRAVYGRAQLRADSRRADDRADAGDDPGGHRGRRLQPDADGKWRHARLYLCRDLRRVACRRHAGHGRHA